jgi:hypothetical protein
LIPVFREYLALNDQLPLEGVGYIRVRRISAQLDIAARVITSPYHEFYFDDSSDVDANGFLGWLSSRDNLPLAIVRQQYLTVLNHLLASRPTGELLAWKGIGNWERNASNTLQFTPERDSFADPCSVKAEKVIRENVSHVVQVGETAVDSITMANKLSQKKNKSLLKHWLLGPLFFLMVITLIVWVLLVGSVTPAMFSNPAKVIPTNATPAYRN